MRKFVVFAALAAMTTVSFGGTTYTWKAGGQDLKWSNPGNWLVNGVVSKSGYPVAGDTAVFSSTYVKAAVTLASETVSLGEGELTIQVDTGANNNYVYISTTFDGPAKLVKTGSGRLHFTTKENLWTGGTEVRSGTLYSNIAGVSQCFGSGTVTIKPALNGDKPRLSPSTWNGLQISNRIEIVTDPSFTPRSTTSDYAVYSSNGGQLFGPVYSDGDFVLGCGSSSGQLIFSGEIHAHGHKLYAYASSTSTSRKMEFANSVDADLVVKKCSNSDPHSLVLFSGVSTNVDNKLTIVSGTNAFSSASAYWGGTNIVINPDASAYSPRLKLKGAGNLNRLATLSVKTNTACFVEIPSGQTLRIRRLLVNGTDVGSGLFTSEDFAFIVGGGSIFVGDFCVWTGDGEAGQWTDPDNWENGTVPMAGAIAYFGDTVAMSNAFNFGDADHPEAEFGIYVPSGKTVTLEGALSGGNRLVKYGAGILLLHDRNTYSGGTIVMDGDFEIAGTGSTAATRSWPWPGTGPIELRRKASTTPHLVLSSWCVISNDVLITGPRPASYASNYGDFKFNNVSVFYGDVTATGDFKFHNQYNNKGDQLCMYGDVSASGHTMYATTRVENSDKAVQTGIRFFGTVNANVEKDGQLGQVTFREGSQIGFDEQTLVLKGGTNVASAASGKLPAARIGVKDITIDNTAKKGAALQVCAKDNLDREAVVRLVSGGKLIVNSGVWAKVTELWIDGEKQADGWYAETDLPQALGGAGHLRVGPPGGIMLMVR